MTDKKLPAGTTQEEWDRYYEDLKRHQERVRHERPSPEKYGYESSGLENQGGWTIEGGEDAYKKALSEWQMMRSCDAPNKPGYYRASND